MSKNSILQTLRLTLGLMVMVWLVSCKQQSEAVVAPNINDTTELLPPSDPNQEQLRMSLSSLDTIMAYDSNMLVVSNPYKFVGKFRLKGSMHNHTTNSDGSYNPIEAAVKIRDEGGCDFYTITDHNVLTSDPKIDGIVWMGRSVEDTKEHEEGQHLCVYNLPDGMTESKKQEDLNELILQYKLNDSHVSYAHPDWWYQVQPSWKIKNSSHVWFVEVLNSAVSGSERAYNILLSKFGYGVYGFGVDDFHNNGNFNKSWIVVFADAKEKSNIWKAILRGAFYASKNGGQMEISCQNGLIKVSAQKESTISFIGKSTDGISELGLVLFKTEKSLNAEYQIKGTEGYVYVKVQSGDQTAISQAIVIIKTMENASAKTEEL